MLIQWYCCTELINISSLPLPLRSSNCCNYKLSLVYFLDKILLVYHLISYSITMLSSRNISIEKDGEEEVLD